jgi:hypothetical protein
MGLIEDNIGFIQVCDRIGNSKYVADELNNIASDIANKFSGYSEPEQGRSIIVATGGEFVAFLKFKRGKLIGSVYPKKYIIENKEYNYAQLASSRLLLSEINKKGEKPVFYFYGDKEYHLGDKFERLLTEYKVVCVNKTSYISRNFKQTQEIIKSLEGKKLEKERMTFLNGTPYTTDEAVAQSFDVENINLLKEAKEKIDARAANIASNNITSKNQLINELQNSDNDFMCIIAHSDGKSIYFGSNKVTLQELSELPKRERRTSKRVGILFICISGDLYKKRSGFLSFMQQDVKTLSEILIEKNYFDLVLAPSSNINAEEVIEMMDQIDKHEVLELRHLLSPTINKGEIRYIATR